MSTVSFKCPGCGHDLIVNSNVEIKDTDEIEGTTCSNCGRTIHEDDIISQLNDHAEKLIGKRAGISPCHLLFARQYLIKQIWQLWNR